MKSEKVNINNYNIDCYDVNTLIIGSGAAALNAAVSLHSMGIKDIIIATSRLGAGTSNNAGSDKQTYYKLSLSGNEPDSVIDMANDLFSGKCMHGDIALCEAQGSVQAFMRLAELGVRFPHDKYGSFAGYKTDHDPRSRATSAGPYTSRKMFEALAAEVRKRKIRILDHHHCVSLLTDESGTEVTGALAVNTKEKDHKNAFVLFNAANVILGTGGPAGIYQTSAYPTSQTGSTGMAFTAGAIGQNLTESQFGIASTKFRWNLSGSYQQAVPRYISTDENGNDEKEFLNEYFPDLKTLVRAVFLKGYQWPFDACKVKDHGSSLIDILVDREINDNQRKVFLDYTHNPAWNGEAFSYHNLDNEVKKYLEKSGALGNNPFDRLKSLNSPAIDLYREHGIDLEKEYLQIAVCNQHNNGGLKGNIWWESNLKHLFPVGEVNGSHGVYRPGGSALNSGQVGSYRAAQRIARYKNAPRELSTFLNYVSGNVIRALDLSEKWMAAGHLSGKKQYFEEIRKRMSDSAGIFRNLKKTEDAVSQAYDMIGMLPDNIGASNVMDLCDCFLLMDHCITHYIYLKTINFYLKKGGRSRGSYIVSEKENADISVLSEPLLCNFDREIENKIIEVSYKEMNISFKMEGARKIPVQDLWFEKIWKEYLEDN